METVAIFRSVCAKNFLPYPAVSPALSVRTDVILDFISMTGYNETSLRTWSAFADNVPYNAIPTRT